MVRCALLGCGGRGRQHALAYRRVTGGHLVAICDHHAVKRQKVGDECGIAAQYADLATMLAAERPDVLHVVTLPHLRVEPLRIALDHQVPVVIVEKPIALQGEDYRELRALAAGSATRVCVNTQLHFHAANLRLKDLVRTGEIGSLRGLDTSARSTPLDQGVHLLELAHSYAGFSPLRQVFGQVGEPAELDSRQPAPGLATARLTFASGLEASLVCGLCAPFATDRRDNKYHHKQIAAYGDQGYVHWTMHSWDRYTPAEGPAQGRHDYDTEDEPAQARLTEAALAWATDPAAEHPCCLDRALDEFEAVLGLYVSALEHRPVELPFEPPDGLLDALRRHLD